MFLQKILPCKVVAINSKKEPSVQMSVAVIRMENAKAPGVLRWVNEYSAMHSSKSEAATNKRF